MTTIEIELNGERTELPLNTSVAQLVRRLELAPEQVAVERNRRIVRRAEHASVVLVAGDVIEVVTLVGGG